MNKHSFRSFLFPPVYYYVFPRKKSYSPLSPEIPRMLLNVITAERERERKAKLLQFSIGHFLGWNRCNVSKEPAFNRGGEPSCYEVAFTTLLGLGKESWFRKQCGPFHHILYRIKRAYILNSIDPSYFLAPRLYDELERRNKPISIDRHTVYHYSRAHNPVSY